MMIDSLYTPACTTTDGIALFCAAAMARLIAVNCADPSRATVRAVGLDVAEDADVDEPAEELETMLEEEVDADGVEDDRLEVVVETAGADVDDRDDEEIDVLDAESDWAAARPTSPTKAARNCMLV
jgi:uncharacterized hydantoinase/oxoprolinase family protein